MSKLPKGFLASRMPFYLLLVVVVVGKILSPDLPSAPNSPTLGQSLASFWADPTSGDSLAFLALCVLLGILLVVLVVALWPAAQATRTDGEHEPPSAPGPMRKDTTDA